MRTRDVLRWHWSAGDLLHLAGLTLAGALLVALGKACARLEAYIDGEGNGRAAYMCDKEDERTGPPGDAGGTGAGESRPARGFEPSNLSATAREAR